LNNFNKAFSYIIVYAILTLLCVKILFSYLDVEIGWWIRHLTPNYLKYNFFNLPIKFSEYIEYGIIPLAILYIVLNYKKLGTLVYPILISFILFFLNFLTAYYNDISLLSSINYSLKIASPIYLFIVFVLHYKNGWEDLKKIAFILIILCCFLSVIGLIVFDVSYNRGSERLPLYFSGLHSNSYVLASVFTGICFLLKDKKWGLYLFMIISLFYLIIGWNVRTAVLFYSIVVFYLLIQKSLLARYFFAKFFVLIPIIVLVLFSILKGFDWDSFSSGRLTMYQAKLEILEDYTLGDYLIGKGRGSDLVSTSEWWWTKKASHNDFITYSVENGLLYVVTFIVLLLSLVFTRKQIPKLFMVIILGYLATSAISNGFSVRPLASYILFIMLAMIYVYSPKKSLE
tara:strand:+ start:10767 stop:11966 length:1200 start_codon:yes stop_codon:yes gene_type:complete